MIILLLLFSLSASAETFLLIHGNTLSKDFWFEKENSLGTRLQKTYGKEKVKAISYLTPSERQTPQYIFHQKKYYKEIKEALLAIPAEEKVTLIAHSLGVSLTLATLQYYNLWNRVQKFINIAGDIRGIPLCKRFGPANPLVPTCNSENLMDPSSFGFYPSTGLPGTIGFNRWTDSKHPDSLRFMPQKHPDILFKTVTVGLDDEVICKNADIYPHCKEVSLFENSSNHEILNLETKGLTHMTLPHALLLQDL